VLETAKGLLDQSGADAGPWIALRKVSAAIAILYRARFGMRIAASGATVVIPVYDEDHRGGARPWAMWGIFAVSVLGYVWLVLLPPGAADVIALNFGVVPAFVTGSVSVDGLDLLMPPALTLATYMLVHGNWLHLTGNMIFLWVFGDDVEAAVGHARFVLFYFLCGVAGGIAHVASGPASMSVLIGASGAIAGIVAAYLILRPWAHVTVLVFGLMTLRIHAFWLLGAWIAWESLNLIWSSSGSVSYWSHAGGLLAGAGLIVVLRRTGVKLFQNRARHSSKSRTYL
jgi:membrane associated rhomboid family serine protease